MVNYGIMINTKL